MVSFNMIKISDDAAVNPKHIIAILFNKTNLKTMVVFPGGVSVESGKTFEETISLLTPKEEA